MIHECVSFSLVCKFQADYSCLDYYNALQILDYDTTVQSTAGCSQGERVFPEVLPSSVIILKPNVICRNICTWQADT